MVNLTHLVDLDVSDNRITFPSMNGSLFYRLESLDASNNELVDVPRSALNDQLTKLALSSNRLTTLPSDAPLHQMEFLYLDNNLLTELPANVTLTSMVRLHLENNNLGTLPSAWCYASGLQYLYLESNNITHLPNEFGLHMPLLTTLSLSNNSLVSLPPFFGNLSWITNLDLSSNNLTSITSAAVINMPLDTFNISNNLLEHLPAGLHCNILDASSNRIRRVEANIHVATIILRRNLIELVSTGFLSILSFASLEFNQISQIILGNGRDDINMPLGNGGNVEIVADTSSLLIYLNLSHNAFRSQPSWNIHFPQLVSLDLSWNQLTAIDDLASLVNAPRLQQLDLSSNPLKRFTSPTTIGFPHPDLRRIDIRQSQQLQLNATDGSQWFGSTFRANSVFDQYDGDFRCHGFIATDPDGFYGAATILVDPQVMAFEHCLCFSSYAWYNTSSSCQPCPAGLLCDPHIYRPVHRVQHGWYPIKDGHLSSRDSLLQSNVSACWPGMCSPNERDDFVCSEGHDPESMLCSKCLPGYYRIGHHCIECGGVNWLSYLWVPLALILAHLFVAALLPGPDSTLPQRAIQTIVITWAQLTAVVIPNILVIPETRDDANSYIILSMKKLGIPWGFECTWPGWDPKVLFWITLALPPIRKSVV